MTRTSLVLGAVLSLVGCEQARRGGAVGDRGAVTERPRPEPPRAEPARADLPPDAVTGSMVPIRAATASARALSMDKFEVTVEAYGRCVLAGKCAPPGDGPYCNGPLGAKRAQHPINCVRQPDAVAFCAWAGKRLPSEAEWELAAATAEQRRYPWGNDFQGTELCWDGPGSVAGQSARRGTCPVGSFPGGASALGVEDMAGNVFEWTTDIFLYPGQEPQKVTSHAARGGSWVSFHEEDVRASSRLRVSTARQDFTVGFRCVRESP